MMKQIKKIQILTFIFLVIFNAHGYSQKYTGLKVSSTNATSAGFDRLFDGNLTGNQWQESTVADDIWFIVDLGADKPVGYIKIYWEAANAKAYNISFSTNGSDFTNQKDYSDMAAGNRTDNINLTDENISCRYIKFQGVELQLGYGYSIYEFEVYPPVTPELSSLVFLNKDKLITKVGENFSLFIEGKDQMGNSFELSQPTSWSVKEDNATVSPEGVFRALVAGFYTVTATNNGISASALVEAIPNKEKLSIPGDGVEASSVKGDNEAAFAFDGNYNTRWESISGVDPQWIKVDLGHRYAVTDMRISWETANAKDYKIEVSDDGSEWSQALVKSDMPAGTRIDGLYGLDDVVGRYVRLTGTKRNENFGYSIFEWALYGVNPDVQSDKEPPTVPTDFTATPAVYAVFLQWTASTDNVGVDHYKIFKDGAFETLIDGNSTSMTISNLSPDTEYTFSIRAYDAKGNESEAATLQTRTNDNTVGDVIMTGVGNIAAGMSTECSSVRGDGANQSNFAVDGNVTTRWESEANDEESITVNLGLQFYIGRVILRWEAASGKHYVIEVSVDNVNWLKAYEFNGNNLPQEARVDDFTFNTVVGQYIRMRGIERNTPYSYSLFEFEVYSPGSGPDDVIDPNPNPNPEPILPGEPSFKTLRPSSKAMVVDTRRPTLEWETVSGAQSYEIWLNITRDDYDWYKCGSLLDRFTKVGESATNSFTLTQDLPDRWTYKWYIVTKVDGETKNSDLGQFSLYLPAVTAVSDGIKIIDGCRDLNKNGKVDDYENWRLPVDVRVTDLMAQMTIEEKAYQMFYNAQNYPLAGWAFGPGTVSDMFLKQKTAATTRLGIPFVSAGDNIHGYQTTYPTQSTMAASRNLDIAHQVTNIQRTEQIAVGARGVLGPLAEVGTKVLYPRIQEGCGEDADFAAAMVRAMISGFQNGPELCPSSIMVTTKHWPGEGAGGEALIVYDAVTAKYHMKPWFAHMDAGGGAVMPGYAGSSFIDPGGPGAGDSKKITDYLRNIIGFDGVVCTDWLPWGAWIDCALAGADVMGGADPGAEGFSMDTFIREVGEERINEAVKRILTVKFKLGVFEDPYGNADNKSKYEETWYTKESQELVIDAARQSMTLLKNEKGVLPLDKSAGKRYRVVGSRANDGDSYRIWTSYFHREHGAKTMYEALRQLGQENGFSVSDTETNPDASIVIIGEPTYTHGTMWNTEMPYVHDATEHNLEEYDLTTLQQARALGKPVVVVLIMPRPFVLSNILEYADAILIAYRPGDGAGPALNQVLFGDYAPKGRLPWQLPRSMEQVGTDNLTGQAEKWDLPFDLGATTAERQEIRSKIILGEHLEPVYGDPLFQYGYGMQGYTTGGEPIGMEEISVEALNIYPNPVHDVLTVRLNSSISSIEIYNVSGTVVLSKVYGVDNMEMMLDVSGLDEGFYIVRVKDGKNAYTQRFIKK